MLRPIIGESKAIKDLIQLITRVASANTNLLVTGESGTGKELVARMIHEIGPLKTKPFVAVNCGAIPENLIESELFGHKKGSFTGAVSEKQGLFEVANTGTIFLDEVGELPLGLQVKLLRVIQDRSFRRVGGTQDVKVVVRIIAATNRDLEACVKNGTFREDLFYRLNVIQLRTPPLRERKGDITILANYFLKQSAEKQGKDTAYFSPEALEVLQNYPWPGNVRELENVVERALALGGAGQIAVSSLPASVLGAPPTTPSNELPAPGMFEFRLPKPDYSRGPIDLEAILGQVEKVYLQDALAHTGGIKKKAAELLGITFRSIRYRLKKLGLD